ncbi:Uncharacterised protein [Serratia quinivorans]|nr:Uncharacterised protein [Serratia quinivorans]
MPQPLTATEHRSRPWPLWKPILFLLVVAVGLYYVTKSFPPRLCA